MISWERDPAPAATLQLHLYTQTAQFSMKIIIIPLLAIVSFACAKPQYQPLPPLREQAALQDKWTASRLETIPQLLEKHNVDAWLVSQREYAEDTAFWSLKRATQFSARRRTTSLFLRDASYTWIDNTPQLWSDLKDALGKHQPARIAVNAHPEIAFASGLHAGEAHAMARGLGAEWTRRLVVAPKLAVEYIATQPADKLEVYRRLQETAWAIIDEGFSERAITPGKTTTTDVEWWMRERIQTVHHGTWFHPSVSVVDEMAPWAERTIQYGDILHVDFGVSAMGMNTDTQHLGYVLHPGEKDVPQGVKEGLKAGNALQDMVRGHMKPGRTGNEILAAVRAQMADEGRNGKIYCHPIGDWGHSAGTVIGTLRIFVCFACANV